MKLHATPSFLAPSPKSSIHRRLIGMSAPELTGEFRFA